MGSDFIGRGGGGALDISHARYFYTIKRWILIDIDSDLKGVTRKLTKYSQKSQFPNSGVPITQKVEYPICGDALTDESRATHPAWMYRALPQNREYPLFLNPQENVCMRFHNNLNTRLLERDNFVPKIPCLKEK